MNFFQTISIGSLQDALSKVSFLQWKSTLKKAAHDAIEKKRGLSDYWTELEQQGAMFLSKPISVITFSSFQRFGQDGNRKQYEQYYFDRRSRLRCLAMLSMYERDERRRLQWIKALEDIIWEICNEYSWVLPAHTGLFHPQYPYGVWDQVKPPRESVDLFASETAFSLSEISGMLITGGCWRHQARMSIWHGWAMCRMLLLK